MSYTTSIDNDFKINVKTKKSNNYLIKINDDYKLITTNLGNIYKLLEIYYDNIELHELPNYADLLMSQITESNSYLKNNDIQIDNLIKSLKNFSDIVEELKQFDIKPKNIFNNKTVTDNTLDLEIMHDTKIYDYEPYDNTNYTYIYNSNKGIMDELEEEYSIYFNNQFNNIKCVLSSRDYMTNKKVKEIFPEFIHIENINLTNKQLEEINNLNNELFANIDEAKIKINLILKKNIVDTKLSINELRSIILDKFEIDNNPNNCIKFSNILNIIFESIKINDKLTNYFKRQLPIILADIGLSKKRLSDGIYWYGLVLKKNISNKNNLNSEIIDKPITEKEYKDYIKIRENEISKEMFINKLVE